MTTFNQHMQSALTLDEIRALAPSAFAVEKHSSRSERYAYIPTSAVIEAMLEEGFAPFMATQSRSRIEGKSEFTKHMLRFRHPDSATNGTISEVVLVNSHDGTSAYKLFAGIFRTVCANGMIVADKLTGSISVPHTGNVVDRVLEGSFKIVRESRKSIETTHAWEALQLTSGEQAAYAEAAHTLRFADAEGTIDTPITAAMLLKPRRREDVGSDLWHTMNRVQENVIKGGLTARAAAKPGEYRGRQVTTRQVKGIDQDVRLNRAMWQLAERMAELKSGNAA